MAMRAVPHLVLRYEDLVAEPAAPTVSPPTAASIASARSGSIW